jgi:hypothetical protein
MKDRAPQGSAASDGAGSADARPPGAPARCRRNPAEAPPSTRPGNQATTRTLARWAKHPDPDKQGVLLPDVVADEYLRFNPPKNQ